MISPLELILKQIIAAIIGAIVIGFIYMIFEASFLDFQSIGLFGSIANAILAACFGFFVGTSIMGWILLKESMSWKILLIATVISFLGAVIPIGLTLQALYGPWQENSYEKIPWIVFSPLLIIGGFDLVILNWLMINKK